MREVRIKYGDVEIDVRNSKMFYKGNQIPDSLISDICLGYERMCTANYLLSSEYCENIDCEEDAWEIADMARDKMDDYNLTEYEAIEEAIEEYKDMENEIFGTED